MAETSISLLERLRQSPDDSGWQRFVDIYTPLIRHWLGRYSVSEADADDLTQEVLTVVLRRMPDFIHARRLGAFRRWLKTITVNCLRDFWKARGKAPVAGGGSDFQRFLDALDDPESALSRTWDHEHDQHVTQRLLEYVKPLFKPKTWEAFERVALHGHPADQVAAELGLSVNAVVIAKSRVLSKLRQEGAGLID